MISNLIGDATYVQRSFFCFLKYFVLAVIDLETFESRHENTGLWGFCPGLTETSLYKL